MTELTDLSTELLSLVAETLSVKELSNLGISKLTQIQVISVQTYSSYWKSQISKLLVFELVPEDTLLNNYTWKVFYKKLHNNVTSLLDIFLEYARASFIMRWVESNIESLSRNHGYNLSSLVLFDRDDVYELFFELIWPNKIHRIGYERILLSKALRSDTAWKILTKLIPEMPRLNDEISLYSVQR